MLGISRVKVTRLLARAREIGMVQITVNSDASPYALLETQLVQRFGLDEAVVVPGFDDEHAPAQTRSPAAPPATSSGCCAMA